MLNRRQFLEAGGGIVAASTLTGSSLGGVTIAASSEGSITSPASSEGTMTMLFIDDHYLNRWEKVTRHVGQPELEPEATFRDPEHWTASGYPTAFRHESGLWRMVYQGKALEPPQSKYPLVVESEDGIHWRIPDLSKSISLPGRRFRHQLFPIDEFREWDAYYDDQTNNPEERVKGLVTNYGHGTLLWVSPDGLKWKKLDGVQWRPYYPDPPSTAFWNQIRGTYIINARPQPKTHPRRIAFSETKDWRTYTEQELVLSADAQDTPLAELYGMPVFPYADKFVGLLWIYHTEADSMRKYWEGTTDVHLTYSYNGWHFQRTLRDPIMPNPGIGQPGNGVMRPHCLLVHDDEIRIYSSSSSLEHGYHIQPFMGRERKSVGPAVGKDHGALLMHRLRLDGFMYIQSNAGRGRIGTRALFWQGGEARLNVHSAHEVRVQVTDVDGKVHEGYSYADCHPFKGDELYWTPRWKGGRGLSSFANKGIRLEIELNNARIFAIRGDCIPMSSREIGAFLRDGTRPVHRPGF